MTDSNLKLAARGVVLGALVSASMTAAISSAAVATASCTLGQDTDAVLREIGLTSEQIEALQARGIVAGSGQGQGAA